MNAAKIKQRMDEYFENTTPEQLIEHLEALGVEFVDIKDSTMVALTLLEQLNKSPKWPEFVNWYKEQSYQVPLDDNDLYQLGFIELPFEFQRGVFEKFIEDNSHIQRHTDATEWYLWTEKTGNKYFETFEQLLIYYFTEI